MELIRRFDKLKQIVERVLINRIKNIGNDEHTYYKYPSVLIEELAVVIDKYLQSNE